ncbi:MAG: hypothetical protein IT353_19185 [Gemmatimonadaceae bacterium]|nr:hypothetical protein [Gemmatimonadaceae bacterium]
MNGILAALILWSIALWAWAGVTAKNPAAYVGYAFGVLFVYALVAAVLAVIILLAHSVVARTFIYLKWPFVLLALTCLLMVSFDRVMDRLTGSDTVLLRVVNGTGVMIDKVEIFGRGDHVEFDTLRPDSAKVAAYRGRKMKFPADDLYPGQVRVTWHAGGQSRERILVQEFHVIGDSMVILFPTVDSIALKGWSGLDEWRYPAPKH